MPITNLGRLHLTAAQITAVDNALGAIETVLLTVTQNLDTDERVRYGSINETHKLLVNKVRDYRNVQPSLSTGDVDWTEFEADYQDRVFADTRLERFNTLARMLSDFKIIHDFDNYQDALTDYDYTKYKSATKAPGFTEKADELKQFFPKTGTTVAKPSAAKADTPPT